jgi:NarL family two-component system response regulator LiaR
MIRVMIVDDHEMVRIGLAAYLKTQPDFEVVAEAADGKDAVQLSREIKPDVVLMDLVMSGMDGIAATREICRMPDAPKVIVLTSFIDDEKVYPALEAGAFSYLLKTSKAQEIAEAIRLAMKGQPVLEAEVTGKVLSRMRRPEESKPHEALTAREMQILKLIAEGKTNQEIADALCISIRTVKTHITHILDKLQVDDRTQAAVYAHRNKLVD